MLRSFMDTSAGEVYADENPTTMEPSETESAAKTLRKNHKKTTVTLHCLWTLVFSLLAIELYGNCTFKKE